MKIHWIVSLVVFLLQQNQLIQQPLIVMYYALS